MKIRNLTSIGLLLFGAIAFSSCSEEKIASEEPTYKGEKVNFSINNENIESAPISRVAYNGLSDGKWDIVWNNGDKVNIHKHNASDPQKGTYSVTPVSGNTSRGDLTAEASTELTWTEGVQSEELFSTVYPSSADLSDNSNIQNDEVVVKYDINQSGAINGNEVACNMENMRMLGHTRVKKTQDAVTFHLDPITTTLKIVVNGPASGSVAFSSVVVQIANNKYIAKDGSVKYKFDSSAQKFVPVVATDAPSHINFIVGVDNNLDFIDLASGQSISLTAFIPGIDYAEGDVKISIHMGSYSRALKSQALQASGYYTIKTPNVPTSGDDNWITPLDDDIIVSSMSIPGTFQSVSYDPWAATGANLKVQDLTLDQQWNMGIRAFYVDSYVSMTEGGSSYLYPGIKGAPTYYASNQSLKKVVDFLRSKLTANPGEFAVLIVSNLQQQTGNYDFTKYMQQFLTNNQSILAQYEADMTIGKLRGKILLMHGDKNNHDAGLRMTGWSGFDGATGISNSTLSNNSVSENLRFLNADEFYHNDACTSEIVLMNNIYQNITNHGTGWAITIAASHTKNRNRTDYAQFCKDKYSDLQNVLAGYNGNTGILILPFVGSRRIQTGVEENPVYGDIMYKTIIDKNYRFTPLKKSK